MVPSAAREAGFHSPTNRVDARPPHVLRVCRLPHPLAQPSSPGSAPGDRHRGMCRTTHPRGRRWRPSRSASCASASPRSVPREGGSALSAVRSGCWLGGVPPAKKFDHGASRRGRPVCMASRSPLGVSGPLVRWRRACHAVRQPSGSTLACRWGPSGGSAVARTGRPDAGRAWRQPPFPSHPTPIALDAHLLDAHRNRLFAVVDAEPDFTSAKSGDRLWGACGYRPDPSVVHGFFAATPSRGRDRPQPNRTERS